MIRWLRRASLLASLMFASSCVLLVRGGEAYQPDLSAGGTAQVDHPVKVFETDGAIVVFRDGALLTVDSVAGTGLRYSLGVPGATLLSQIPTGDVVRIEVFEDGINGPLSAVLSVVSSVAGVVAGIVFGAWVWCGGQFGCG